MKILQIIPSFELAGAETMCENLCIALKKQNQNVIAVSLYSKHTAITERLEEFGVPILYLNKKSGFDISMYAKLAHLFKDEKPDIIHFHLYINKYVVPAAMLCSKAKIVYTMHSIAEKESGRLGKYLNQIFLKFKRVNIVALSDIVQRSVIQLYGIPVSNIPIVYNGSNISKCKIKKSYGKSSSFTIIHVGRFMEVKNHLGLLRAFKKFHEKHSDTILQLIGDGELRPDAERFVRDNGIESAVQFLGLQADVHPFLEKADMFTLPSRYEGIPMTLIEAMGTGLPIVATCVGGIPDMIQHGKSGLLCGQSEDEIAEAFEQCYANEELREQLGRNALDRSRAFSADEMARRYLEIYES